MFITHGYKCNVHTCIVTYIHDMDIYHTIEKSLVFCMDMKRWFNFKHKNKIGRGVKSSLPTLIKIVQCIYMYSYIYTGARYSTTGTETNLMF